MKVIKINARKMEKDTSTFTILEFVRKRTDKETKAVSYSVGTVFLYDLDNRKIAEAAKIGEEICVNIGYSHYKYSEIETE